MKIALLSVHSCPLGRLGGENTGGMSVYVRELAREFGRRGHKVDVFTRVHHDGPDHPPVADLGENARLIHVRAGQAEETDRLSIYARLDDFTHEVDRFKQENALEYDLIHSHYWLSGRAGKALQRSWSVPHLITFHTLGAVKNTLGIGKEEPLLRLETEEALARNCHRIIGSTPREREDLIRHYGASPETIRIVPCGVDLDLFRPIDKGMARCRLGLNGKDILLSVGRIIPLKGIDRLLTAMSYLERGRRPTLIVIGGDEHTAAELGRLRRLTEELTVSDSVDFIGFVRHEALPLFYSAADLCVVSSYYESFGLVALESLACGTPVLSTRVGGVESVIEQGETGCVVENNAPRRLAREIAVLLSHSKGDSGSKRSIRASVARFSWSNTAEAVLREYAALLEDPLRRAARKDECSASSGI